MDQMHQKRGVDVIPMWVADMNFKTVPTIQEAMIGRIEHPTYGYFNPRKKLYRCNYFLA